MPFIAKSAAPRESNSAAAHWTFDRAAVGGLTLFTAPPGYLLTEGLSDALRRQGRQTLWIRLGPEDRDPGTLLLSVLAAVQHQRPGFGRSTLELMRRRPGPVAGWPPLFGRLAAELAEAMPRPAALVFEHAHHLSRAHLTLGLLGGTLLPALNADTACVLMSHEDLPLAALPANVVRRSTRDLRLSAAAIHELLQRNAPALGRKSALRAAALCRGGAAALMGLVRFSVVGG